MGSNVKKQRRAEKLRQKSSLRMSVLSAGDHDTSDEVSMAHEVKQCHAAMLYADEVRLISPRAALMKSAGSLAACSPVDILRLMVSLAPSIAPDKAELFQLAQQLIDFPRTSLPPKQRAERDALVDSLLRSVAPSQMELQENLLGILERSGFNELRPAIDQGILSIDDLDDAAAGDQFGIDDGVLGVFAAKIQDVLTAGNVYPLFDAQANDLVRMGVEEGIFTPVKVARRLGSDAAMAAGLFDRLPNFPYATTAEILDIRRALARPLTQFRTGVRGLTEAIQVPPESDEFAHEIEDAWNMKVAPALDEIDEAIRNDSSLRDLMSRSVQDAITSGTTFASALTLAGSIYIAAGPNVTMPLAAAVAAGFPLNQIRAFRAQSADLRKTTETQFYFLYGADKRIRAPW